MKTYYLVGQSKTVDVKTSCLLVVTQSFELAKLCAENAKKGFKNLRIYENKDFILCPQNFNNLGELIYKSES